MCFYYLVILLAAEINPRNNGCGRFGLDLSSGCACVAMNHGCCGFSIISTIRLSGERPQSMRPFSVRMLRKSLLTS